MEFMCTRPNPVGFHVNSVCMPQDMYTAPASLHRVYLTIIYPFGGFTYLINYSSGPVGLLLQRVFALDKDYP